jgi:hypothetical protein
MKKTLSIVIALFMLISAIPFTAYADTPVAKNLTVTNAKSGSCTDTVELSWEKGSSYISYDYHITLSKSFDGRTYTVVSNEYSNVGNRTSYTYYCEEEDYGKTIYLAISYEMRTTEKGSTPYNELATVKVNIKKGNSVDLDECREKMLKGLADPKLKKTTNKYDGKKFVKGTKAIWDCQLYKLTAEVTKVSGTKATFKITFKSKIDEAYVGKKAYSINIGTKTFYPEDKITYTVDTSKTDGLATSPAAGGYQYFKIRIDRTQIIDPIIYSSNKYFSGIVKNHDVDPENSNYISRVYLSDTYALSYYVKPTYKLTPNSYSVGEKSITLGTYGFASTVKYRAKGASKWTTKSFKKNKKITISGLKANTAYEIKVSCKLTSTDPETGKKKSVTAAVGDTVNLATVINKKPEVTSVKVSNIKTGTKTINGYWESDGDWHPTENFKTASYTVTVNVKNVPKNAKGLVMKVGGSTYYATGNKKSYTFKLTYQDKKSVKGKKLTGAFSWSSNTINKAPVGVGPAKSVSYKITAGTYK